ncbi:cyclic nucleotide-binding domain-containing protein [Aurantivibrio plasticivorans]
MIDLAVLRHFSAFDDVNPQQVERIQEYLTLSTLPKGTFIHKRSKSIESYCYLISGHVDLVDSQFNCESVEAGSDRQKLVLVEGSPSPVSAQAKSEVELLVVDPAAFKALAEGDSYITDLSHINTTQPGEELKVPGMDDDTDWMSSLLEAPLFTQISPAQLQQIFHRFEPIECESGDTIVREGESGDYFYVIERGVVDVTTRIKGLVATLESGDYFGEEALVGECVRNATVTMTQPGVVMRLGRDDFKDLLHDPLIRHINVSAFNQFARDGAAYQLVDVRLPVEYRVSHVEGAINIPLSKLRERVGSLDHGTTYIVTDDGEKRSEVAAHLIGQAGYTAVILQEANKHHIHS